MLVSGLGWVETIWSEMNDGAEDSGANLLEGSKYSNTLLQLSLICCLKYTFSPNNILNGMSVVIDHILG